MKNLITVIGKEKDEAGYFDKKKKAIIIAIHLQDNDNDSFERLVYISGATYKKFNKNLKTVFIIECTSIKHLNRITPSIQNIYQLKNYNHKIIISKSCNEFFS